MRWGERLEFVAEAGPGDFIYVPPYVPHQEINASDETPLSCVLVRSGQEPVVVNLDLPERRSQSRDGRVGRRPSSAAQRLAQSVFRHDRVRAPFAGAWRAQTCFNQLAPQATRRCAWLAASILGVPNHAPGMGHELGLPIRSMSCFGVPTAAAPTAAARSGRSSSGASGSPCSSGSAAAGSACSRAASHAGVRRRRGQRQGENDKESSARKRASKSAFSFADKIQ